MSSEMRLFYARVGLSWGFVVRFLGTSAAQPSYLLPPPTTIVGAFAYPLLRLLGISPRSFDKPDSHGDGRVLSRLMKILLSSTAAASCGVPPIEKGPSVGFSIHQEVSRIVGLPYKGGTEARRFAEEPAHEAVTRAMPVQAVGASYGPRAVIDLLWVVDIARLASELRVRVSDIDSIGSIAVKGVSRLGSKEGIVAVHPERTLYTGDLRSIQPGEFFRSYMYIPAGCAQLLDEGYAYEVLLPDLRYRHTAFYVPASTVSGSVLMPLKGATARFKLVEPCRAYTYDKGLEEGVVGVGGG